jgi:hypothetical protein
MAYNPGVSDISGQLRAQGMTRGMNSLLEGFDVGIKTYQQNKHIADTSIADFGAAVSNSDELKALLTDEEQRSKLPSDVVKAYLKLNKEGSLGVREASLLGGFARSFLESAKAKQQQAYQAKMMQNVDQQIAASQQAGIIAQAQNARDQAAANRIEGQSARNLKAVQDLQSIVNTADTLGAGYPIKFPARPVPGPASVGSYRDALGTAPLSAPPPARPEDPFRPYVAPQIPQVPNSPLRSGTTTPTPNVNVLEDFRNKRDYVPVAGNMGGAGVLTVQAADRFKRRAADLEGTSLEQMIRAGITPTDDMIGNSVLKDSANQIAAAKAANAAENQRVRNELQGVLLEIRAAKLGSDPSPVVASMRRAYDEGIITRDEQVKYIKDFFIKAGTPPESQAAAFERLLTDKAAAAAAGKPKTEAASTQTPKTEAASTLKPVGSSEVERRRIPLGSEFMTNETPPRLMYKDKNGNFGFGPLPTK